MLNLPLKETQGRKLRKIFKQKYFEVNNTTKWFLPVVNLEFFKIKKLEFWYIPKIYSGLRGKESQEV